MAGEASMVCRWKTRTRKRRMNVWTGVAEQPMKPWNGENREESSETTAMSTLGLIVFELPCDGQETGGRVDHAWSLCQNRPTLTHSNRAIALWATVTCVGRKAGRMMACP